MESWWWLCSALITVQLSRFTILIQTLLLIEGQRPRKTAGVENAAPCWISYSPEQNLEEKIGWQGSSHTPASELVLTSRSMKSGSVQIFLWAWRMTG